MYMKYINTKKLGIVLFSKNIDHSRMFEMLKDGDDEVVSAGFVNSYDEETLECYGESFTLGVSSRKEDTKILQRMFI